MTDDPTRWSHSSGEMKEAQERINKANEFIVGEATVGMSGNATDLLTVVSSGQRAKEERERIRAEREERVEREEREKEAREKEARGKEAREEEEREGREREKKAREEAREK